uniref:DUF3160 domain-containing protein n=1 Tax=Pinguiococcus pyrenoidosus TaxID=172671 RepID=A0A7R9U7D3_9STRA|mmetsp:Transcript_16745/g.63662  ORF Transcript_16745/g.63662 Transcript_16745/m.63662 type:complete len:793 (+) Transcript_16745:99-2477(+)
MPQFHFLSSSRVWRSIVVLFLSLWMGATLLAVGRLTSEETQAVDLTIEGGAVPVESSLDAEGLKSTPTPTPTPTSTPTLDAGHDEVKMPDLQGASVDAEIRYLDVFQTNKTEFNDRQIRLQQAYEEEHGRMALYELRRRYEFRHHDLLAWRSRDFSLSAEELQELREKKVLFKKWEEATFAGVYETLYTNDMPVFVTSDSMLYAFHRFYDEWLEHVEESSLIKKLTDMCDGLLTQLRKIQETPANAQLLQDLEVFFAVPVAILNEQESPADVSFISRGGTKEEETPKELPKLRYGGDELLKKTVAAVLAARDDIQMVINGVVIRLNGSTLKPRGHYTNTRALKLYFAAFTWLAAFLVPFKREIRRADFVREAQLAAALAKLAKTCTSEVNSFLAFVKQIVGEPDNYTLESFLPLIDDVVPDEGAVDWILAHGEELATRLEGRLTKVATLRTIGDWIDEEGAKRFAQSTFSIIGRGNAIDNVLIQQMVDDNLKVDGGGFPFPLRKLPRIVDLVYTLFDNPSVQDKLEEEMKELGYTYWQHLERLVGVARDHQYPQTLYNHELQMLRALSADRKGQSPFNSEAWLRKQAQAQIAHYAELRHDNVLYLAEAFGDMTACSYIDLMIEPVPTFWAEFSNLVGSMIDIAGETPILLQFKEVIQMFQSFLRQSETGQVDAELMQRLKAITRKHFHGSGPPTYDGWYARLFNRPEDAYEYRPEVSSFFTAPPDNRGRGKICHLGTGEAQLMYILVGDGMGREKVMLGPVYTAYEVVTEYEDRMNDQEWAARLNRYEPLQF